METQITPSGNGELAPSSEKMNIFLTGATTALGRDLTRQLVAAGHTITGAVTTSDEATQVRADGGLPAYPDLYRAGEVRSTIVGMGAKVVINLAPTIAYEAPQRAVEWSTRLGDAAKALSDASKSAGIEYLIHASSALAEVKDQDAAPALRAMRSAERAILNGGVPAVVLRFGYLYGPESSALTKLRNTLRAGRPVLPGSDDAHAAWTYLSDAASAVLLALQKRPTGMTLNIVDDQAASPAAFIRYFAESLQISVPNSLPNFLRRAILPKTQLAILNLSTHASNTTAKETLGWTPHYPNYRQGIDDLLLQWRATEPVA